MDHDQPGRPTQVVAPNVGGASTVTTAYAGLTTTVTDLDDVVRVATRR